MDLLPIKRALISVTDKTGLDIFATFLASNGVELISTGGTLSYLQKAGLQVTAVDAVTGFPEIMGGRVKTLHPAIHGGILADKDTPEHMQAIAALNILPFDLVCVNLYDFAKAEQEGRPPREAIEQIDIGGPCMLRAAAKNYHSVMVVPHSLWYAKIIKSLQEHKMKAPLALRASLSMATFATTAAYDGMIVRYMSRAFA